MMTEGSPGTVPPFLDGELIAVLGATGRTGIQIVRQLLNRNATVKILVRNIPKAEDVFQDLKERLHIVRVDIGDKSSIQKEIEGCKWIISALGGFSFLGKGALTGSRDTPYYVDYMAIANLTNACKDCKERPKRLVLVSSAIITRSWNPIHILLNVIAGRVLTWKAEGERVLRQSGIPYTIVRPVGLVDEGSGGVVVGQGDTLHGRVSRKQVAETIIAALGSEQAVNTTFEVSSSVSISSNVDIEALLEDLQRDE